MSQATTEFDPSSYTRPPRLDVRQAIALGIALLSAAAKPASAQVKKAAQLLRGCVLTLQAAWAARRRAEAAAGRPQDKHLADNRIDTAWGGLKARLDAYANLPADQVPLAPRAAELSHLLFAGSLEFLTLPMEQQWAEGENILQRIAAGGLQAEIDLAAGREFLAEVQGAQAHYGEVLGITRQKPAEPKVDTLLDPLRQLTRAIGDYSLQVVASVDRDDPETVDRARVALAPLDRVREAAAKRATARKEKPGKAPEEGEALDVSPETPVPGGSDPGTAA